jgi:hypothetical protein
MRVVRHPESDHAGRTPALFAAADPASRTPEQSVQLVREYETAGEVLNPWLEKTRQRAPGRCPQSQQCGMFIAWL